MYEKEVNGKTETVKKVYGPYTRKDGRKHVVLQYTNLSKKTISYPKYLMEQKIGRELTDDETVDHKDEDFTNDDPDNLRILTREENVKRSVMRRKPVFSKCVWCGKEFQLTKAQIVNAKRNSLSGKAGPFCTRKCSGQYGANLQNGKTDKLETCEIVKREYYKLSSSE